MMQAPILSVANKNVGTCDLDEALFGGPVNEALLWEMVRMQTACRRQGTHQVKNRSEVVGSGRKLWRQKGTGRARIGSRKSPIWRGGGTCFGPSPRDYSYSMPKKKRKAALRSALAAKLRDEELIVVDSLGLTEVKTKTLAETLGNLGVNNALIVVSEADELVMKSAKNIPWIKVLRSEGLNVYDILCYDKLIMVGDAIDKIEGGL
jgi:large subunit ribosomal protein L4